MSAKPRRTVLSGVVTPLRPEPEVEPPTAVKPKRPGGETIQQTLYLQPPMHDQLRELAFAKRVKMHALVMEGLDHVFRANGMKSIAELCEETARPPAE